VIKKLGEGNFSEVYKVTHKAIPTMFFALKICKLSEVQSLRRETDIILEKHSLIKLRDFYKNNDLPCVKLLETFKDGENLYFLTEILEQKNDLWVQCRSFGLISAEFAIFTFREICKSVA